MSAHVLPVSRRSALLAAAAAPVVLAGCTVRSPLEEPPAPEKEPVDPDLALRDSAHAAIRAQVELARGTAAARPRLAGRIQPLLDLHATHLEALPGAPSRTPAPVSPGTWADVIAGESALRRQLSGFAQRAESGGFARLLASMAAAIGQVSAR